MTPATAVTLPNSTRRGRFSMDKAYERLRELIIRGHLPPGSPVPEEMLAETLKLSRTPLRNAIQRLEVDGLLARRPNGRLYVTEVSAEHACQLFAIRIVLEDLALREALERLTDEHVAQLRHHIDAMCRSADAPPQNMAARLGVDFHESLYQAGGNEINLQVLASLQGRIDRYRYLSTEGASERQLASIREHQVIYEAVAARQVEKARAALRLHLENAKESVFRALAQLHTPSEGSTST
jgi:DNA-binding GntR family transcriptional regulator